MKTIKLLPPILLLMGCMTLMQYHGIKFWTEQTGDMGFMWSLLLEGCALWLWTQRSIAWNVMPLLATVLVLAGPLHEVGKPLAVALQTSEKSAATQQRLETDLRREVATLEATLVDQRAGALIRPGFGDDIIATLAMLESKNTELAALVTAQAKPAVMPWLTYAVISMQLVAMLIFQAVIVLAIRTLNVPDSKKKPAPAGAGDNAGRVMASRFKRQLASINNPKAMASA